MANNETVFPKGALIESSFTSSAANSLFSGNVDVTGNVDVAGTLTANELHITETTRSILYESGSTNFGDTQDDTHTFTGSVYITGSEFQFNGSDVITVADTASIVVDNAVSASYADFAENANNATTSDTASYILGSNVDGAVTLADTASYVLGSNVDGAVAQATSASHAVYADTAGTAATADTASYILGSNVDGAVAQATSASHALYADVAGTATNADTASYIQIQNVDFFNNSGSGDYYHVGSITADDFNGVPLTINSASNVFLNGEGDYVTVGGAQAALSASLVGYGDSGNNLSGSLEFTYDSVTDTLSVPNISASGFISASAMVSVNTLDVNGAQYTTNENIDVDIGTEVIDQFPSGALCSAEWLACIKNVAGGDYRTSKVLAVWDPIGNIQFTEYSTQDIGNTNQVDLDVIVTGSDIALTCTVGGAAGNDWSVKVNRIII
jgi:hypothetical protein